jgi:hypothetical protein
LIDRNVSAEAHGHFLVDLEGWRWRLAMQIARGLHDSEPSWPRWPNSAPDIFERGPAE